MVKKKSTQFKDLKQIFLKIFLSLIITFVITLLFEKLQKKNFKETELTFQLDRNVRMGMSLLPNYFSNKDLGSIIFFDNSNLIEMTTNDISVSKACSFIKLRDNDKFISITIRNQGISYIFISDENVNIELCKNEINELLNSLIYFYFKNLLNHKKTFIDLMKKLEGPNKQSTVGQAANMMLEYEALKSLLLYKENFFSSNHISISSKAVNKNILFFTIFISVLTLLNLNLLFRLIRKIKKTMFDI